MRILSCKFLGRCRFPCTLVLWSCKALLLASELPTFYEHFSWCPWIPHLMDQWNTTQSSGIVELRFFDSPLVFFSSLRHIRHIFPNLWPQSVWWRSFASLSVASRTMKIHSVVLIQHREPSEPCPRIWHFSVSMNVPTIVDAFSSITSSDVLVALVTSVYFIGIGNDSSLGTCRLTLGSTCWR